VMQQPFFGSLSRTASRDVLGALADAWGNERLLLTVAVAILSFSLLPYFLLGPNAPVMVWDNLDSVLVSWKVLLESGSAFGTSAAVIPNLFTDLPRALYPSELSAFTVLFSLFGYYWGYVANRVLQTLVGFLGMRLLLGRHLLTAPEDRPLVLGVAVAFAVLPHWPLGGLSVAGLPLVFAAFLNLRAGVATWRDWSVLSLFPLYSSLVLVGLFLAPVLLAIIIFDACRRDKILAPLSGLALLTLVYVAADYRLFLFTFGSSGFVSHRTEFSVQPTGVVGAIRGMASIGINGSWHSHSLHRWIILPTILAGFPFVIRFRKVIPARVLSTVGVFLAITILWYGLIRSGVVGPLIAESPVQLHRVHLLHPVAWYVLFAGVLASLTRASKLTRPSVAVLLALQILVNASNHEIVLNRAEPSFAEFFAEAQFKEIEAAIGRPKQTYRVVSLGLDPMVPAFNGFYTVDGYVSNYPLEYKRAFAEVIRDEMKASPFIADYFGNWGSRVYLFSSALIQNTGGSTVFKARSSPLSRLGVDMTALQSLGAEYLISAVPLVSPADEGLDFMGRFMSDDSAWDIHLYRLESASSPSGEIGSF